MARKWSNINLPGALQSILLILVVGSQRVFSWKVLTNDSTSKPPAILENNHWPYSMFSISQMSPP